MNKNIEKKYKRIKKIYEYIAGKASGIIIAGVFCFITSKLPKVFSFTNPFDFFIYLVMDSTIVLATVIYPIVFLLKKRVE